MKTSYKGPFRSATVEMIRSVVTFALAADNVGITESIPAFFNVINSLEANLANVDALKQIAEEQITGYAAQKRVFKASLVETSTMIMQAVYSYAMENGDAVLANQMRTTKTKLNKMKFASLVNFTQDAVNVVTPIVGSLSPYNITSGNIATWQTQVTALGNVLSTPNNAIAHRKSTNEQIQAILISSMVTMTNEADTLALGFKQSNPAYYSEYLANRKLKPYGHMSTQLRIYVTTPNHTPVTVGEVFLIGTDKGANLNSEGYALIDYIPFGNHYVEVTTPVGSYQSGVINFKKGHSRTLHVQVGVNATAKTKTKTPSTTSTAKTAVEK